MNCNDAEFYNEITKDTRELQLYNSKVERKNLNNVEEYQSFIKITDNRKFKKVAGKILDSLEDILIKNLKTSRYGNVLAEKLNLENDELNDKRVLREFIDKNIIELIHLEFTYLMHYCFKLMFLTDLKGINLFLVTNDEVMTFITILSCKIIHRNFYLINEDLLNELTVQDMTSKLNLVL